MYLPPSGTASIGVVAVAACWISMEAVAAPAELRGDVPGLGPVTLGDLQGQPVSVVLMGRNQTELAEPIGQALNSVMVELGGRRVSVLDLSQSYDLMRPVLRQSLAAYRSWVVAKVRDEYEPDEAAARFRALLVQATPPSEESGAGAGPP